MKTRHLTIFITIILILGIVAISGCVDETQNIPQNITNTTDSNITVVETGDTIAVEYEGRFENGTVFDTSAGRAPLLFDAGSGQMIKGFDDAVIGMAVGDKKTVTVTPEDAYGESDPEMIVDFPITAVPNDTQVGDTLFAETQPVKIVAINSTTVTIDLNHPMVGKTLIFDIEMIEITKG